MSAIVPLSAWQRWLRQPQKIWLRRALFQVHLWSGIAVGLYILVISITGSVLVYWNEMYRAVTPIAPISKSTEPRLTDGQLTASAARIYPGFRVAKLSRGPNPDQAVSITLERGKLARHRFFDVRTGADLGDSVTTGMRFVAFVLDLHDNLLAGPKGRTVNGAGAVAVLVLAISGLVIWWPGSKTWRRSLIVPRPLLRKDGWKRAMWHLHSMLGFWTFVFVVIFALSGLYLCFPDPFQEFADWLQPVTVPTGRVPFVDQVIYWLAYLHFGRIGGIGIPCKGPGFCDQATKATWAFFGLTPAAMFVTGAIMWWNRVLHPRLLRPKPVRARQSTEPIQA